jgi:large subunit ribosomal protein L4
VWRGGGVAFGPHPRDYSVKLNRKVGKLAFRRVVSDRIADGTLVLAEELTLPAAKTKELVKVLKAFGTENALLVVKAADDALTLAARNLPGVEVATAAGAGVYQMMAHEKVVVARAAWEDLARRLEGKQKKEIAQ